MEQRRIPFTMRALMTLSREGDFEYVLEPVTGDFAYVQFQNGVRHYVSRGDIRVNLVGPHEIAKNKFVTDQLLEQGGYPIILSKLFYSPELCSRYQIIGSTVDDMIAYATSIGYPLIVKPNDGFQGMNVYKITDQEKLVRSIETIFETRNKVLLQKYLPALDYRVVVYRGVVMFAYQRLPLAMHSDGVTSIHEYLKNLEQEVSQTQQSIKIDYDIVASVLERDGKDLSTIPQNGEILVLLDNANLSTGGTARDVSDLIHPEYCALIVDAVRHMNLNLAGVDILVQGDISASPVPGSWAFLEVNASPGFEGFANISSVHEEKVLHMFRTILKDVEEGEYQAR